MNLPVLTRHARERCDEMQVPYRTAMRIWEERTCTYEQMGKYRGSGQVMVFAATLPGLAAVVSLRDEVPVIITVLFKEQDRYERDGTTFRPLGKTRRAGGAA